MKGVLIPTEPFTSPSPVPPRRILIVEDHRDTAEVLARLMVRDGHHVDVAATLAQGRVHCRDGRFDIILCDIGLPDGSGVELAKEFLSSRPQTKFIALTGWDTPHDQAAITAAGFHAHFVKPFNLENLRACME